MTPPAPAGSPSAATTVPPATKVKGSKAVPAPKAAPVAAADTPMTFAQIQKSLDTLSKSELNKILTTVIGKTNTRVSAGK